MTDMRNNIISLLSILLFSASCTVDPIAEKAIQAAEAEISADETEIRVPYDAVTAVFSIRSNSAWFAEAAASEWVTSYSRSGNSGEGTFVVGFTPSPKEDTDRQTSFELVSVQDESKRIVLTLKQAPHKYFIVDRQKISSPSSGGEYFIDITSNVSWRIDAPEGLGLSSTEGKGTGTVRLTVPVSSSFEEKTFEVKVVTDEEVVFGEPGLTKNISISQEAAEATFVVSPVELNVEADDTEAGFTIFENVGYTIEDGDGVTHTVEDSVNGHEVTLHFAANTGSAKLTRTCTVRTDYVGPGIQQQYVVTVIQAGKVDDAVVDFTTKTWPFAETYVSVSNQKKEGNRVVHYTLPGTPYSFDFARGLTQMTTSSGTSYSTYDWKNTYGDIRLSAYTDGSEYIQVNCPEGLEIENVEVWITSTGALPFAFTDISEEETVWSGSIPKTSSKSVSFIGSISAKNGCRIRMTKQKQQYKISKIVVKFRMK